MKPWNGDFRRGTGLEDETTGFLFGELVTEAKRLVRDEVQIAKTELRADAKEAGAGVSFLAVSAAVAHGAFFAFIAAVVLGLSIIVHPAIAAALVAMWLLATAGILAGIGRARLAKVSLEETIATVKEDGAWAGETMRAARSSRHGIA